MLAQIVLFDGFDLLDAIVPYEVLNAAGNIANGALNVELVTAEGARSVQSGISGLEIRASGKLNPEHAHIIIVPGAAGEVSGEGPNTIPAILGRAAETELTNLVRSGLNKQDLVTVTVCGGSLLLAMGGLLDGRHAVTHHLGMDVLGATGAVPVSARVVDDGNLITGGGVTSGLDVALYVVERELGPRIAHEVEKLFEYERSGTVWCAKGLAPIEMDQHTNSEIESTLDVSLPKPTKETSNYNDSTIFDGKWDITIATPIGKQFIIAQISTKDGIVQGSAEQNGEISEFIDPVITENRMTWTQHITKPMSLKLKFEATVDGNKMEGVAKAGVLPSSKLTGERIS
ncbi:thiamine biosynthesis protein ThiJ [Heyndrickxia shackletonii]|uniref:Thiamine biosynthesis protein ThiJ n=1 Tax=Heyndrickxia shackletonii TaxID=157838 RepID=A0A0Q3WV44_9BACI|nr:DJ-1/PfpI family protein [Heyndrickxia shackletonii]KQL52199.1 thiamine biosynthesis protein ThiJ [Heyndrickxia shackletonii]NEZ02093.1 DJ-1/PfpI family protein [Heyndrickxia shackletonii]